MVCPSYATCFRPAMLSLVTGSLVVAEAEEGKKKKFGSEVG